MQPLSPQVRQLLALRRVFAGVLVSMLGQRLVVDRLHDLPPLHREVRLRGRQPGAPARLRNRDPRRVAARAVLDAREREHVATDAVGGLSGGPPPVSDGDRDRPALLARLDERGQLQAARLGRQRDDVAGRDAQRRRGRGRHRRDVAPGQARHRIGQLLQPRVVGVAPVARADGLVQGQLVSGVGVVQLARAVGARHDGADGFLQAARERTRRHRRARKIDHAPLERPLPEALEAPCNRARARVELALPECAQVSALVGRAARPRRQAFFRRARVVQRRDQRLPQAEVPADRLGVAPRLEEMVVRADRVDVGAGFVSAIGERDRQRDLLKRGAERDAVWMVVDRVRAPQQQRVHSAAVHVVDQRGEGGVVTLPLQRRPREIDGRAGVAQDGVQLRHHDLRGHVVAARHDQRFAAAAHQRLGGPLDRSSVPRHPAEARDGRPDQARVADATADGGEQRDRDCAELRRRDGEAEVGVAARDRHAGFALHVERAVAPVYPLPPPRPLARELDRRQPGPEEVGLQRHDDARAIEPVVRHHGRAVTEPVRLPQRRQRHRVVE